MQNVFKRRTVKKHISPVAVILLVLLVLYALMLVGLLFWAFMTSFKSQQEFRLNVIGFPKTWVWNYTFVFQMYLYPVFTEAGTEYVGMGLMFLYSLLYAAGCAFTATLVPCITSYLCARFPYKFGKIVYLIVIVTMVIPIVGNQPSEIQVAQFFGLYDQIWGLWLMKANFLGMYFLVFFAIFRGIPKEYRNTFLVVMLIRFIEFWNDYQTPLIYLKSYPTVALGMFNMANTRENGLSTVPMRMTGAMLMLLPILAIFLVFQKHLIGNITVGGIKG